MGADGVLVGRPLVVGAFGGDAAGVKIILDKMTSELKQAMILTGCSTIGEITQNVIYQGK
ncbi:hypothetical protein N752_08505 [Desulforamulus aquiferis]|nr:hypothetical protein N752_08505 [Desulforamulus aquiferis]